MKIKNIFTILLVAHILVSCAPAANAIPAETTVPNSTSTPIPSTLTLTPESTLTPTEIVIKVENIPDWVNKETQRLVEGGNYADWNDLVDKLVMNNPNTSYDGRRSNFAHTLPVDYCPYVLGVQQGYILGIKVVDVSGSPLWKGYADRVRVAIVAFPDTPGIALIGLVAINGNKNVPIIEYIYGDNGNKIKLDDSNSYELLVGRLLKFRIVATIYAPESITSGYLHRLEQVKNSPDWDFFYQSQVVDRTPDGRVLFEHLVTSDDGYSTHAILFKANNNEASGKNIVTTLYMMGFDFPIILADFLAQEEALHVLYEDPTAIK